MEAIFVPLGFFGFLTIAVYLKHQRKMLEMRLMRGGSVEDGQLTTELQQLRAQIAELRDTTTRYDMSFDSALQRLESRMAHTEQRLAQVEQRGDAVGTTVS